MADRLSLHGECAAPPTLRGDGLIRSSRRPRSPLPNHHARAAAAAAAATAARGRRVDVRPISVVRVRGGCLIRAPRRRHRTHTSVNRARAIWLGVIAWWCHQADLDYAHWSEAAIEPFVALKVHWR